MLSSTLCDELGYLPFEAHAAHLFFQLVSWRYERGSMLITLSGGSARCNAAPVESADARRREHPGAEPPVTGPLRNGVV